MSCKAAHSSLWWFRGIILSIAAVLVAGCSDTAGYDDLNQFMQEVRSKPTGRIKPLPEFEPYEAFTYDASAMRSPFSPPIPARELDQELSSNVKPDPDRPRQFLEGFSFENFVMVGTLGSDGKVVALLRVEESVYPVTIGDYLGKNHGRVTHIDEAEVQLIEIVPSGNDRWIERPRTLRLEK
ncbi:pilus assembly protein PilP [Endozoicomonadaceae bacterium StTr2]